MDSTLLFSPLLDVEQCRDRVCASDFQLSEQFSVRRRAEFLSWRAVLSDFLGEVVEIEYAPSGQPKVVGHNLHIGVSHTDGCVAVVVSNNPCAVDVERKERDLKRISERFLTAEERAMAVDNTTQVAIWCSRECYYKLKGDRGLLVLTDIAVTAIDLAVGKVTVEDSRGGSATMVVEVRDQVVMVYFMD